jgi:hypothetical protein
VHGHSDELCEHEGMKRREIMDLQVLRKRRREETMYEAQQNRLAKASLVSRRRCGAGGKEVEGS